MKLENDRSIYQNSTAMSYISINKGFYHCVTTLKEPSQNALQVYFQNLKCFILITYPDGCLKINGSEIC